MIEDIWKTGSKKKMVWLGQLKQFGQTDTGKDNHGAKRQGFWFLAVIVFNVYLPEMNE